MKTGLLGRVLAAAAALVALAAAAGSPRTCDAPPALSTAEQDTLLRVAALLKTELDGAPPRAALIARSGTDLTRFGARYSHAGVVLPDDGGTGWAVRQLYFDCDEHRPRLFDQGLAGFVLGTDDPRSGYVSIVLLPPDAARALGRAARDRPLALGLLGADYSANAYAFSTRYQNCNQWVAELLAAAWAPLAAGTPALREQAQRWLHANDYRPTAFELRSPLWLDLARFVPWLHRDDHPAEDLAAVRFRVSMPAALEEFVQRTVAGADRVELCHVGRRAVLRHGWQPLADGCRPEPGDAVVELD